MDGKAKITHRVLTVICLLCLVWEFVFYLAHWSSLPEETGIHFASDGTFDVYASKIYGFYPHLFSLITLAVQFAATFVIGREKLKLGLKVNEKGRRLILGAMVVTLDLVALSVLLCFCCWTFAVSTQDQNIMDSVPGYILKTGLIAAFAGVVFQCTVNAVCKDRDKTEDVLSPADKRKRRLRFLLTGSAEGTDPAMFHRLSRLITWISVVILMFICLFALERLPHGDIADEYHGLAWFENAGEYLAKWLVFLPYIVTVPFMVLFETVGIFTKKSGNRPLMLLADRLKLIFAAFAGWWEILLFSEKAIGAVSVSIFAALCVFSVIRYFIGRKKPLPVKEDKQ